MMTLGIRNLVALVLLGAPALASDFYVDVVNGNDANTGTSTASAWKTLTHASQFSSQGSGTTIHVAPGTYSPASGETFPLLFDFQRLVSDQGSSTTILDGGFGNQPLIAMSSLGAATPKGLALLQGFTLQSADSGIDASANCNAIDAEVADCRFAFLSTRGIRADSAGFGFAGGSVHMLVERCAFESLPDGITATAMYSGGTVTVVDSTFSLCGDAGIDIHVGSSPTSFGDLTFTLTRCRFDSNTNAGLSATATNQGSWTGTLADCVLVHNGAGISTSAPGGLGNYMRTDLVRCTVADNFGAGVRVLGATQQVHGESSLTSTIVNGNAPDLDVSNVTSTAFSQIGGPDPLFVDRVHGVYRLQFGSPCIDAGDPATPAGTLDIARVARSIDGNLDTNERADVGAYEFTPLRLVTSGHLGTPLRLESSGETGGTSTIYFTRGAPVSPMSTPFGQFDLNPSTFGTLLHTNVAPFPPVGFQRPIPSSPVLVGHTFSFQGLTTSSVAPQGSAYTNVVSFTVLP
jgi:hypothetical protein